MRKLKDAETHALALFVTRETFCPGNMTNPEGRLLLDALASLAKLNLLAVDVTDDGPSYSFSPTGRAKLNE